MHTRMIDAHIGDMVDQDIDQDMDGDGSTGDPVTGHGNPSVIPVPVAHVRAGHTWTCHKHAFQSHLLTEVSGLSHFFFNQRYGNFSPKEDPDLRDHTRRRLCTDLGAAHLCQPPQVHGAVVHWIQESDRVGQGDVLTCPPGDGLVTTLSRVALGVLTADCVPVLCVDPYAGVIGAIHAGWRGTAVGIISEAISVMERAGAQRHRIHCALGPAIQRASYEVGTDVRTAFPDVEAAYFPGSKGRDCLGVAQHP